MGVVKPNTSHAAQKAAHGNANFFGIPYGYFTDTSGNWRVEKWIVCYNTVGATRVDPEQWPATNKPNPSV